MGVHTQGGLLRDGLDDPAAIGRTGARIGEAGDDPGIVRADLDRAEQRAPRQPAHQRKRQRTGGQAPAVSE